MRTRRNGFVKFMCKLDGRDVNPTRHFTYKEPWPGSLTPSLFKKLTKRIVEEYSVGSVLSDEDQNLVDRSIEWCTVCIENELARVYDGESIPFVVMECFENWYWRINNGEEPLEENYETDEGEPLEF